MLAEGVFHLIGKFFKIHDAKTRLFIFIFSSLERSVGIGVSSWLPRLLLRLRLRPARPSRSVPVNKSGLIFFFSPRTFFIETTMYPAFVLLPQRAATMDGHHTGLLGIDSVPRLFAVTTVGNWYYLPPGPQVLCWSGRAAFEAGTYLTLDNCGRVWCWRWGGTTNV